MDVLLDRLQTLCVGDAMCGRVVEVPAYKTMAEAALVLSEHHISAAPVVDDCGHCVGLLSTADFVKCMAALADAEALAAGGAIGVTPTGEQRLNVVPPHEEAVTRYMSAAVQTVTAEAPLVTAARMMCAQHYHRLLVLDGAGRAVGVLSTMDVVAALVHLADEAQAEWRRQEAL
jgi:CBS-domain-containing membrane protein